MHIQHIEVSNFRKLKDVRIDFSETNTVFVGANNSGKTSAMDEADLVHRQPIEQGMNTVFYVDLANRKFGVTQDFLANDHVGKMPKSGVTSENSGLGFST